MLSDLRYAARSLLKTPGFTLIAVLTLSLGIGATTAIFSVVNTVLLRPLPYTQPERLMRVYTEHPNLPNGGIRRMGASVPEYLDLRRYATSWESLEGWGSAGVNISTSTEPARVTASFVTGGLLRSLRVAPVVGRVIEPQDDAPGAPAVVVISYGLWQRAFGGDRAIVGREISLNGEKCAVIGIMPKGFRFPLDATDASDVWKPMQIDSANPGPGYRRDSHWFNVLGRLKPNVARSQAQAEFDTLVEQFRRIGGEHHFDPKDHTIVTYGLHDEVVRGVRPALRMLLGAVCFLLLIACVNVANLLLARAEVRQREIAIRGALGAGLWRLVRQFATEGLLLSAAGAAIGLILASGGLAIIKLADAAGMPRADEIDIDGRVLLFAATVNILTALIFGLAPLAHVIKRNLHGAMKSTGASTTDAASTQRFRQLLVVSQLALALILLTGTGLMLRAFWQLQQVDAGFDPKSVVTMSIGLSGSIDSSREFWTRLEANLNALPGVDSAALTTELPPGPSEARGVGTYVEGFVPVERGPTPSFVPFEGQPAAIVDFWPSISKRYFDVLQIRLLEGRVFDERDSAQAPKTVVINQTLARMFWGNESPLGRRLRPVIEADLRTVIGVVADAKNDGLEKPTATAVYLPYTQPSSAMSFNRGFVNVAVRSHLDPATVIDAVRREVSRIDPTLPITKIRTMEEIISASQSHPRFLTLLLTVFAGVALALAAVGIYGVISYSVTQRTKEFGIRMALGAQHGAVLGLVLKRGFLLTACGLALGLAGAFALTRFLSGFLFGITPTDPATFVSASLLLGAIAILASYIPARRATKVDPLVALRAE